MKKSIHFLLLSCFLIFGSNSYSQKLSFGGKIGSMITKSDKSISAQSSSAGVFATYTARKFKLGMQLEVNFLKEKPESISAISEFQIPVLGIIPLDKHDRIHLQAGPYIGIGTTANQNSVDNVRNFNWGLTSGIDMRLPITPNISLITDARLGCQLNSTENISQEGIATHNYAVPLKKHLTFNFSIGIAFKSGKKKSFKLRKKIRR